MYLTFDSPEYLWYLLSIPLLVVTHYAFLKYTKRRAIKFANFQALKKVSNARVITHNYGILIMRIAVIICLILSISGTTLWYVGQSNQNDFAILIDTSSSMSSSDFQPTRLDAAKTYVNTLVDNINPDSKIGVISFSGASFIEQLPTTNHGDVKSAVSAISIAQVSGTDIPGAMVTGTNLLLSSTKGKIMILLTDGSNTASFFNKDPIQQGIEYAKKNNIIVDTIGLGTNGGPIGYLPEYYNISSVYDADTLIRIANATGGKYYYTGNTQELESTYKDILQDVKQADIPIHLDEGLLIIALILIFIEWGLINTRFRVLP